MEHGVTEEGEENRKGGSWLKGDSSTAKPVNRIDLSAQFGGPAFVSGLELNSPHTKGG